MTNPLLNRLIFVFSFVGIFLAGYLWYMHAYPEDIPCGPGGGCAAVAQSRYSEFPPGIGPPVAAYGTVGYIILCGLAFYRTLNEDAKRDRTLLLLLVLTGVLGTLFSLYLTAMEAYVIKHWCKWCLGSQALIALVTIFAILDWLRLGVTRLSAPEPTRAETRL